MTDAGAATECKRLEAQLKAARARIRRLPGMPPGPGRQKERLLISADLSALAAKVYAVVENIMEEPDGENSAGPSER